MRLLFVVHRYPPFLGGSEYYVQAMAEESHRRGFDVWVYTSHKSNLNGINVTDDINIIYESFDLIIVHGCDCHNQNIVLDKINLLKSPVLYLIILPSISRIALNGINHANFLGCSTIADFDHVKKYNQMNKAVSVRHSIKISILNYDKTSISHNFRSKYNIKTKYMILSCGGFWANKQMIELAYIFLKLKRKDITLVLTGYQNNRKFRPANSTYIRSLLLEDREEVKNAMISADLYVMNSSQEGFGLVLLEALFYKLPWIGRNIAGAQQLNQYGRTYNKPIELYNYLENIENTICSIDVQKGYEYIINERSIDKTIDDILKCIQTQSQ